MGVILPHSRWGEGATPALLLHGFLGSRHAWDHLRPLWSPALQAIAVDLPGHAGAPLSSALGSDGFIETVDSLAAMLEGPTVVIGYSQGARLALALAARHSAKVSKLVLESGSPGLRRRQTRLARREEDEARARALEASGVEAFVDRWEKLPLFTGLRALPVEVQQQLRERRLAHRSEGLAGALRCLGTGVQPSQWARLPSMRVPTLLVSGELDVHYTRLARSMVAQLPCAWRATLPGVGHAPHLECPDRYSQEVLGFIAAPWRREFFVKEEQVA